MPDDMPPFRADHVGSLLRSPVLKEARARHAEGAITGSELRQAEDIAISQLIGRQEEVGLKSITDGENRRAWWHYDFLAGLDGVELVEVDQGLQFAGVRTRSQGLRVTGKIDFVDHPMVAHFRFLKEHTGQTPKMTIPSPTALHYRGGRKAINFAAYRDMDAFFHDLGRAYQKAVQAFAAAGCTYLQLDDVFLAYLCDGAQRQMLRERGDDPERLPEIYADLINAALAGRPAGMVNTMHLCRGNFRSSWVASGGYELIADLLFNAIDIDAYFMEYDTERAGGFEPLRFLPKHKKAVLGLVTTKTGALETKDRIKRRIEEAAKYADLDRLCLSPQCGFASTEEGNIISPDEQWAKLELVVEVAREVWGKV
ncbi:MAG: 5-methyltetrahydropteroyltriglutamate--homocysteine S-methyltransferase [Methylobacteriaceae bacterium]|nr:5-methyltetrahydropteroyltriglutamate--homocysteine S-methyltransferase [Methylobacteriaceae bacterium]